MGWLRWLPLAAVLVIAAAKLPRNNTEGFIIPLRDRLSFNDYSLHVGKWSDCVPEDFEDGPPPELDSLVHTPRLGVQRRQLLCRKKTDGRVVSSGFCAPDFEETGSKRICVVKEDCLLGEWLPWRPKADGGMVRTRRVRRLAHGGGKQCDVVEEIKPAVLESTAHWVPGPWGECKVAVETVPLAATSDDDDTDDAIYEDDDGEDQEEEAEQLNEASCGGGVQRREATCVRADGRALMPAQCAHTSMPTLVEPCEVPCPRDCEVGEWSEWGACQPTDGCPLYPVQQLTTTGYSVRKRRVVSAASAGGAPCPPLEEKRSCNTPRCASWKSLSWGPCVLNQAHTNCGPGRRTRELRCVGHDGKEAQRAWCSTGAPPHSERCRIACAGDCVVSSWGPWTTCSAACMVPGQPQPYRTRSRHILAHASPTGWPCPLEEQLIQNETCNTHACATYSWLATPWKPCERRHQDYIPPNNYTDLLETEIFNESDEEEPCVEEGEMTRDVMCIQDNSDVVREALCAPLRRPESRRACTMRCHRGCRVEAWMPWSPCPDTCEPGKQIRVRKVHGGPNCGALQESRDCPVSASCRSRDATWVAGEWGQCRIAPGDSCGLGFRVRSIWCGSSSHRVGAGACSGQLVPTAHAPCMVPCEDEMEMTAALTCEQICSDPLFYLELTDIPECVCKNVSLALIPTDSDCILPPGVECGEGRTLRSARCLIGHMDVVMDVCKRFHPLTGPNRVRVPATDGYAYDSQFPALLHTACTVRCARDCASGEWGEWGECASEPGERAAFMFRTREVIEESSAGGRECGATLQRSSCVLAEPRWRVGEWAPCVPQRALCGRAVITRTVSCVDAHGRVLDDSICEALGGITPSRESPCRAPCPSDCVVSEWSEWSPCEMTKWGGRRDRTRLVLRPAEEGGAPCPQLVAAEPCAPHTHSWHVAPWDDCQPLGGSPCGEGTKKRTVRCMRSDGMFVNDTFCPNKTSSESSESWCYVPCGVDCEVGEWLEWDASACSCGPVSRSAHIRRKRQHLTAAVWPGRACPTTEQRVPCPWEPCLTLAARPDIGCQIVSTRHRLSKRACGYGSEVTFSRCEITSIGNQPFIQSNLEPWRCTPTLPGRIITPTVMREEEDSCMVECGCTAWEGRVGGAWGAWGACTNGTRSRTRQLRAPANPACRTSSRYMKIEWSNCTSDADEVTDLLAIEPHEEKPRRAWVDAHYPVYHDGYIRGSSELLAVVWTATIILILYGAFMVYRGCIRCLRSRRMKTITKV